MSDTNTNAKTKTIDIGPFHPELEETVYFKLTANDDHIVTKVDMVNGFVHRGLESLVTQKNFLQNLILTERVCSLCSNTHPWAYAMAIETIAGVRVPMRAEALRVIAEETKRVASNLINLGLLTHLIKQHGLTREIMDAREIMQDVKEVIWGNRMDLSANTLTGVRYDLDSTKINFILNSFATLKPILTDLAARFDTDEVVLSRTRGAGVLPNDIARKLGVTGPVARGSGINNDVRVKAPYSHYTRHQPMVSKSLYDAGDVHARAMARWGDIKEALRIIEEIIDNLPPGRIHLEKRPHIPAGEATVRVEAPRGELIYYLQTDGGQKPVRIKWKVPTFTNWEALKTMTCGSRVEDVTMIVNSIDPCVSCTER